MDGGGGAEAGPGALEGEPVVVRAEDGEVEDGAGAGALVGVEVELEVALGPEETIQ